MPFFDIISYMTTMNKTIMQKITPFLWFDHDAEEAAKFYTSIFKNSKIIDTTYYGKSAAEASARPKGTAMSVTFELEGQLFMALNGGPVFKFSSLACHGRSFLMYWAKCCKTRMQINRKESWKHCFK